MPYGLPCIMRMVFLKMAEGPKHVVEVNSITVFMIHEFVCLLCCITGYNWRTRWKCDTLL